MSDAGDTPIESQADDAGQTSGDDTAAFQRFYLGPQQPTPRKGLLHRVLTGWWRKKP